MSERIICSSSDSVNLLALDIRVRNALRRGSIFTVGELIEMSDDQLFAIRNLGELGVAQVKNRLAHVALIDEAPSENAPTPAPDSIGGELKPTSSTDTVLHSSDDGIDVLGLHVRVRNALKRSSVDTVGQLMAMDEAQLFAIRNLGEIGIAQIKDRIASVSLTDAFSPDDQVDHFPQASGLPSILVDLGPPMVARREVIEWQQHILSCQVAAGTLHPDLVAGDLTLGELTSCEPGLVGIYEAMIKLLAGPANVAQELELLTELLPPRELEILVLRFGYQRLTLAAVADIIGVSRERVRQLQRQATSRMMPGAAASMLARIRSAVLFADNMELSFDEWTARLMDTGLLGAWTRAEIAHYDRVELLLTVCEILDDAQLIELPYALRSKIELRDRGMSAVSAGVLTLLKQYRGETERLVRRHLRYSAAVSVEWLMRQGEVRLCENDLRAVLAVEDYISLDDDWFMSLAYEPSTLQKNSVVHRSLAKMFQYCGPLGIHDIYFGIEHTVSRTEFPVPPVRVLEHALDSYGYDYENGHWYWNGNEYQTLNTGEDIIMNTLKQNGGVVHHQQLAEAFLESTLSFPSLHGTLSRSPLFDNFERSLYKLRGTMPRQEAIEQARQAAERIPVDIRVEYDMDGNIIVEATLGVSAVGGGTILSENLPNLEGEWECALSAYSTTDIYVTENEIRRLGRVFRNLACEVGDRVKLVFSTELRQVRASRIEVLNDNSC